MENEYPPVILVTTWLDIVSNDKFPEAQLKATRNLNYVFGNIKAAERYVDTEQLKELEIVC